MLRQREGQNPGTQRRAKKVKIRSSSSELPPPTPHCSSKSYYLWSTDNVLGPILAPKVQVPVHCCVLNSLFNIIKNIYFPDKPVCCYHSHFAEEEMSYWQGQELNLHRSDSNVPQYPAPYENRPASRLIQPYCTFSKFLKNIHIFGQPFLPL